MPCPSVSSLSNSHCCMVTYQRQVESMSSCTTACCGLLSHQSAKWRVLTRRFNSSQGPFRMEGKVIHSRAQVLLPTGLLWQGDTNSSGVSSRTGHSGNTLDHSLCPGLGLTGGSSKLAIRLAKD